MVKKDEEVSLKINLKNKKFDVKIEPDNKMLSIFLNLMILILIFEVIFR